MSETSALNDRLAQLGGEAIAFGPIEAGVEIVTEFGAYPAEYAAIRRHVGILHLPQRAILELRGDDVRDYLHRMTTQDIASMTRGESRRALQLNDKGRILADMVFHFGDEASWIETDVFDLDVLRELLEARLFTEDVVIEDCRAKWTALQLHGPAAQALLAKVCDSPQGDLERAAEMQHTHHVLQLAGQHVTVARQDVCGVMGFKLFVPSKAAAALYDKLLEAAGYEPDGEANPDAAYAERRRQSLRGRPIGWSAFNTARIEAGSPLFHIDFGPDSIPNELGERLFSEAVSMTSGCYVGQEIVARIKNLGHPKRMLTAVHFEGDELPVAGTQILDPDDTQQVIGGVTSSTLSPTNSNRAIGLAVLKWGFHTQDKAVTAFAEGKMIQGVVQTLQ